MRKQNHWLRKKYDLDGWFHKHFLFKNDTEFMILLVWAAFITLFFITLA